MTNLTEEILEQIDAYKNEGFITEQNIVNAHVQATMRGLLIQEECEKLGIVMEGDIVPERNDEHILKYILLFIPRLIINILNKLYQWITELLHPGITKEREAKAQQELEVLDTETAAMVMNEVCETVTEITRLKIKGSPCKMDFKGKTYIFMWRLQSIEAVIETLEAYGNFFTSYYETMAELTASKTFNTEVVLEKLNVAMEFVNKQNTDYSPMPDKAIEYSEIPNATETFKERVVPLVGQVKAVMNELSKLNMVLEDRIEKLPSINVTYGRKIMNLLDRAHASFSLFCSVIETDISSAMIAHTALKPSQDKVIKKIVERRTAEGIPVNKDDLKKRGVID